jgi:hypothetical protein
MIVSKIACFLQGGRTALHAAAMGGNIETITALMCEFGLSANRPDLVRITYLFQYFHFCEKILKIFTNQRNHFLAWKD